MSQPGSRLRAFAWWCCADTLARIVDPLIADLQHEHARAIRAGQIWRSRALQVGGWMALLKVLAICAWRDDLSARNWTADDRRALIRSLAFSGAIMVAFTGLNLLTVPTALLRSSHSATSRLLLYLIPQALTVTVTIGATLGILLGVGGRQFSRRVGAGLVALALVASASLFVNVGWILPGANRAYRVAMFGGAFAWMPKSTPELTLGEISRTIDVVRREPTDPSGWHFGNPPLYLRDLRFDFHSRWALSFSPLVFAWLALLMMRGCRRRWLLALEACGAFLGYYVLLFGGRSLFLRGTVPAFVATWSPSVMFALIAVVVMLRRSSSVGYEPAR